MTTKKKFKGKVERQGDSMCFIEVPFDVKATFGKARPPVVVTLNGYSYPSTVAVYGGKSYLPLRKSNREAAGLIGGETLDVTLTLDESDRKVTLPKELAAAFKKSANAKARAAWDKLSFSHQREHADAIEQAKKPETRARRVEKCLEMLSK